MRRRLSSWTRQEPSGPFLRPSNLRRPSSESAIRFPFCIGGMIRVSPGSTAIGRFGVFPQCWELSPQLRLWPDLRCSIGLASRPGSGDSARSEPHSVFGVGCWLFDVPNHLAGRGRPAYFSVRRCAKRSATCCGFSDSINPSGMVDSFKNGALLTSSSAILSGYPLVAGSSSMVMSLNHASAGPPLWIWRPIRPHWMIFSSASV